MQYLIIIITLIFHIHKIVLFTRVIYKIGYIEDIYHCLIRINLIMNPVDFLTLYNDFD